MRAAIPHIGLLTAALLALMLVPAHHAHALAQVEISSISDMSLGTWNMGDPAVAAHIDVCIYALLNAPAGGYAVTATGGSGGLVLTNGAQQIPYSLTWDDGGAGSLGSVNSPLTNNSKLASQLNAQQTVPLCLLGAPTARLNLKIAQADMTSALAGTYSGTLTLTISPN